MWGQGKWSCTVQGKSHNKIREMLSEVFLPGSESQQTGEEVVFHVLE